MQRPAEAKGKRAVRSVVGMPFKMVWNWRNLCLLPQSLTQRAAFAIWCRPLTTPATAKCVWLFSQFLLSCSPPGDDQPGRRSSSSTVDDRNPQVWACDCRRGWLARPSSIIHLKAQVNTSDSGTDEWRMHLHSRSNHKSLATVTGRFNQHSSLKKSAVSGMLCHPT